MVVQLDLDAELRSAWPPSPSAGPGSGPWAGPGSSPPWCGACSPGCAPSSLRPVFQMPSTESTDVERRVAGVVEAHVVEDEELGLGAEVGGVGDAGRRQVLLGLLGDVAGVAAVALHVTGSCTKQWMFQRLAGCGTGRCRRCWGPGAGSCPTPGSPGTPGSTSRRSRGRPRRRPRSAGVAGTVTCCMMPGQVAEAEVDELDALRPATMRQDLGRGALLPRVPPGVGASAWRRARTVPAIAARRFPAVARL